MGVEIADQRLAPAPTHITSGLSQRGQAFAHLACKLCTSEVMADFEPQTAFDLRAAGADFD